MHGLTNIMSKMWCPLYCPVKIDLTSGLAYLRTIQIPPCLFFGLCQSTLSTTLERTLRHEIWRRCRLVASIAEWWPTPHHHTLWPQKRQNRYSGTQKRWWSKLKSWGGPRSCTCSSLVVQQLRRAQPHPASTWMKIIEYRRLICN